MLSLPEKVCRSCRRIVLKDKCPICGGDSFTTTWTGVAHILDSKDSIIATEMGVDIPGKYALRVR